MRAEPVLGALLDWGLGEPPLNLHPVVAMGDQIAWLEKKLYNDDIITGALVAAGVVLPWALIGSAIGAVPATALCVAGRSLAVHARSVAWALDHSLEEGRHAVSLMVGRDTANLDHAGVVRATVESVGESLCDGVIAPMFYGALFGGGGAMAYRAVNTLDSMLGHRDERYERFGKASARLDDVLGYVPARLSAVFLLGAAAVHGLDVQGAYTVWRRDHALHPSPNSAHGMAAMAGALGIRLGGPVFYDGVWTDKPWIGDDLRPPETQHIHQAVELMMASHVLATLALAAAAP